MKEFYQNQGIEARNFASSRAPSKAQIFAIALGFLAGFPLAPRVFAQAGPTVWVAPSLERVKPDSAAGSGTEAQIRAARGEYESFQIVVRAPSGGLNNVNVSVSDLIGPGGSVIPKSSLTLYREHYVYIGFDSGPWWNWGSNSPQGPGWYPDGLIPFVNPATGADLSGAALDAVPFSLAGNRNQPIWVDVLVPRTAAPGLYTGSFTVTSTQGSATGQVTLMVWNFTLPMQPSLRSSFEFWVEKTNVAAHQELLRHRLSPLYVNRPDQRSLIDHFGLGSTHLGFWTSFNTSTCTLTPAPSVSAVQAAVASQQPDLFMFNYTADEIDRYPCVFDQLKQWGRNLHQGGAENLATMKPVPELYDDGTGSGRSAVDIWVLLPLMYDAATARVGEVLAKGDEVWSYNTIVQDSYSPKWLIDYSPIDFRVQTGFINQSLSLNGLLYWKVDHWSSDPWNNVDFAFAGYHYAGEGMLVYPGTQVGIPGVAPSMRLKWLRDGVDDFEYVEMLKDLGRGDWAIGVAHSVGADWSNWTRNPSQLESARSQLGQEIDRLSGGGPPPKASTTTTVTSSLNPSKVGDAVTFTASVSSSSGTPTGSVEFFDGTSSLGVRSLSGGQALLSTSSFAAGSHSIKAVYGGDANYNGSTSAVLTQTVNPADKTSSTTAVASSLNPSEVGESVTFVATVSSTAGTPTGTVEFFDGTASLGSRSLSSGQAALTTSTLASGKHPIKSVYGGDSGCSGSTSAPLDQTVNPSSSRISTMVTLGSSANPAGYLQPVTFTVVVTPRSASGTVVLRDSGVALDTAELKSGVATFTMSWLSKGVHRITAEYGGDDGHTGSESDVLSQKVNGKK